MSEDQKRVLIVDQERFASLISKMLAGRFLTATASTGPTAIDAIRKAVPDAFVVDEAVGGIRLAELVGLSPRCSHVPVILTSARPSPEGIIRSRNAGVSAFLAKPFRPSEIQSRIQSALDDARPPGPEAPLAKEDQEAGEEHGATLRERVKSIDGLPSFPATHAEIMKLARSEDASSDDLAEKIQLDPSFLAQVLRLVNSSYYGFRKPTTSLKLAVTLIGMEEIGGQLASAWKFSENYTACIACHHEPKHSRRHARLVRVIHIADCMCRQIGYGSGGDSHVPEIGNEILDHFSIAERGLQILVEAARTELDDADSFLGALSN